MSKKMVKYIIIYLPVTIGIVLISSGIGNVFSYLLLFLGGYVALKSTINYRVVNKNVEPLKINDENVTRRVQVKKIENYQRIYFNPIKCQNKKVKVYSRVRKKY